MHKDILAAITKALQEQEYGLMTQSRYFSIHGIPMNVGKSLVLNKEITSITINQKTYIPFYERGPYVEVNWNGL